ncbi:MAG TPA: tetratricopeptide repeat protein [Thermoanaerobaculia bacterium]|jgi:tetratricopeptide (TPR) repeat protein
MLDSHQSILADIDAAMLLIEEEDYANALPLLARVVAFGVPEVAVPAYHLWVRCHLRLERTERALQLAEEGLARGILPFELQLIRAEALGTLERYDEGIAAAEAAHELDPDSPEPILILADMEVDRGRPEAALQLLQDALRRYPDEEEIHFALVMVADELGRPELVIQSARDYLRKFGKADDVLAMLGYAYLGTGDLRRADRAFRDAAQLEPDDVELHVRVLGLAVAMKNDAGYDAYLERLRQRDPELAELAARGVGELLTPGPGRPGGRGGPRRH